MSMCAPLLSAESADEFASLRKAFKDEIQPEGPIENMYLDDFAELIFEIRRLRRYMTAIVNCSRLAALQGLLQQLLDSREFEFPYLHEQTAEELARGWFEKEKAKNQVAKLLRKYQMDEEAIDAEAFRQCSEEVERIERILTALEFRRDKALHCVADYRRILSKRLQRTADQILDNDDVPRLIAVGKRSV
jgi:hypothetical protein